MVEKHEEIPGLTVHYQWKQKKNLSMRLYPDRRLVVRSPAHLGLERLRTFVSSHRDWITRQLQQTREKKPLTFHFGDQVFFMGYPLLLMRSEDQNLDGQSDGLNLWHQCPDRDADPELGRWLRIWYRSRAEDYLPERVSGLRRLLPLPATIQVKLNLRWMKRRWGSCRKDGRVTLNTALMICPEQLIDYVIVHELAHLVVASHQPAYYRLLESWLPGAKEMKQEMDRNWGQYLF